MDLNIRIPIMIPIKGKGFINQGSGLPKAIFYLLKGTTTLRMKGCDCRGLLALLEEALVLTEQEAAMIRVWVGIDGVGCFARVCGQRRHKTVYADPLKNPKNKNLPNMNPLLHCGNWGIIRGFHFLDPLGGLGRD